MGTIQKRSDNAGATTYQVKIRRAGFPRQSRTFLTRADAERWEREIESEISRGVFVDTAKARVNTLRDVLEKYRLEVTPPKKGAKNEATSLKLMERDSMAEYAIAHLTPAIIANWRDRRLAGADGKRPVCGSTVNRQMNLLHHVLEVARKDWGIGTGINPVKDVRRPKSNPSRDKRLSREQEQVLLESCSKNTRKPYLRQVVEIAIESAMRLSEIVYLEWERIDLEDQVAFHKTGMTKNDESRGVPLSKRAVAVLKSVQPDPALRVGRVWPGLTSMAVTRSFARVTKKLGMSDFRFHDTRHEATSRIVESEKFSDTEVMSITGHKNAAMMRRYTHLNAKNLARKLG